jgi:hypothetical protein
VKYIATFACRKLGSISVLATEHVKVPFESNEQTIMKLHEAAWAALRENADHYYATHEHFSGPARITPVEAI